jgi:hypothetical protein
MMGPRHDLECLHRAENRSGQSQLDRRSESGFHLFCYDSPGNVPVAVRLKRVLSASSAAR